MDINLNDTYKRAIMMHGIAMLPRLRSMTHEERMQIMKEAQEISLHKPIWMDVSTDSKKLKNYLVQSWSKELISAAQVIALIVFGLWVSIGECADLAQGLLADWPDIPACIKLYSEGG